MTGQIAVAITERRLAAVASVNPYSKHRRPSEPLRQYAPSGMSPPVAVGFALSLLLLFVLVLLPLPIISQQGLIVNTDAGPIIGRQMIAANGRTVFTFQGIPYAQPPIASQRWKARTFHHFHILSKNRAKVLKFSALQPSSG